MGIGDAESRETTAQLDNGRRQKNRSSNGTFPKSVSSPSFNSPFLPYPQLSPILPLKSESILLFVCHGRQGFQRLCCVACRVFSSFPPFISLSLPPSLLHFLFFLFRFVCSLGHPFHWPVSTSPFSLFFFAIGLFMFGMPFAAAVGIIALSRAELYPSRTGISAPAPPRCTGLRSPQCHPARRKNEQTPGSNNKACL